MQWSNQSEPCEELLATLGLVLDVMRGERCDSSFGTNNGGSAEVSVATVASVKSESSLKEEKIMAMKAFLSEKYVFFVSNRLWQEFILPTGSAGGSALLLLG